MDKIESAYKENNIHPQAFIDWNYVTIGTGNDIGPFTSIGTKAQHKSLQSDGQIIIGDNNVIRELCTIHLPTNPQHNTVIGNDNYFMANSHIAHDCLLENNITLCNNATLGGHTTVMHGATIGFSSNIHQFQVIGSYSMLGMMTCVPKGVKIYPGQVWIGNPARFLKDNTIGLQRNSIEKDTLAEEFERFNNYSLKWSR